MKKESISNSQIHRELTKPAQNLETLNALWLSLEERLHRVQQQKICLDGLSEKNNREINALKSELVCQEEIKTVRVSKEMVMTKLLDDLFSRKRAIEMKHQAVRNGLLQRQYSAISDFQSSVNNIRQRLDECTAKSESIDAEKKLVGSSILDLLEKCNGDCTEITSNDDVDSKDAKEIELYYGSGGLVHLEEFENERFLMATADYKMKVDVLNKKDSRIVSENQRNAAIEMELSVSMGQLSRDVTLISKSLSEFDHKIEDCERQSINYRAQIGRFVDSIQKQLSMNDFTKRNLLQLQIQSAKLGDLEAGLVRKLT